MASQSGTSAPAESRRATYDDLLRVPEPLIAEIIDGEVIASPRPASRHTRSASVLGIKLGGPFDLGEGGGPGGWWIADEPELHLGEDVLVPNLAGWRRERMSEWPDVPYFTFAPDWICEVLSPATERVDRIRKLRIYAREGVSHAWLLNPVSQTLEGFRLEGGHWALVATHEGTERVRAEPFEAIEIGLGDLWSQG